MSRAICKEFMEDLQTGCLSNLLKEVINDSSLIMELRGKSVIIYYRGGALFTILRNDDGSYSISYNPSYWRLKKKYEEIQEHPSIDECIKYIAYYKNQMDYHLTNAERNLEKQSQQRLVQENNVLGGSLAKDPSDKKQTPTGDYFIIDTEYAYKSKEIDARFDAVALKWPSLGSVRKNGNNLGIAFLELKYYDGSMSGASGIQKHISDFLKFTQSETYKADYIDMCKDMTEVFRQKCRLGLIPAYTGRLDMTKEKYLDISIDPQKVEMIFMFANRDPDSIVAPKELAKCIKEYGKEATQNIYVATSSDMGYVMFRYSEKGKTDKYIPICDYVKKYDGLL